MDALSGQQKRVWQRKGVRTSQEHYKDVSAVPPTSRHWAKVGRLIGAKAPESSFRSKQHQKQHQKDAYRYRQICPEMHQWH